MFTVSRAHRFIVILLNISGVMFVIYASVSIGLAMILVYRPPLPVTQTPSSQGLHYRNVAFPSRDDHLLLLKTNMGSGHFGASGRYEHIKETAFNYAFILNVLGIE